jgi:hypothetical protein
MQGARRTTADGRGRGLGPAAVVVVPPVARAMGRPYARLDAFRQSRFRPPRSLAGRRNPQQQPSPTAVVPAEAGSPPAAGSRSPATPRPPADFTTARTRSI